MESTAHCQQDNVLLHYIFERMPTKYLFVEFHIFLFRVSEITSRCAVWSGTGDCSSRSPTLRLDVANSARQCPWAADSHDMPHHLIAVLLAAVCNRLSADKSRPHFDCRHTMYDTQLVIRQAISLLRHRFILHSPSAIPRRIITAIRWYWPRQGIKRSGRRLCDRQNSQNPVLRWYWLWYIC